MDVETAFQPGRLLRWLKLLVALLGAIVFGPMIMIALMVSLVGATAPLAEESIWSSMALSLVFFALGGGGIAGLTALALSELIPAARKTRGLLRVLRIALAWGVLASAVVGLLYVWTIIDTAASEFAADPTLPGAFSLGLLTAGLFLMCGLGTHTLWQISQGQKNGHERDLAR